ncbi:hypothetical protein J6590_009153 [Homalodisca vitripennis]|nr:hypothetical protein J6590_009153 [Homalodisca vitripennis]
MYLRTDGGAAVPFHKTCAISSLRPAIIRRPLSGRDVSNPPPSPHQGNPPTRDVTATYVAPPLSIKLLSIRHLTTTVVLGEIRARDDLWADGSERRDHDRSPLNRRAWPRGGSPEPGMADASVIPTPPQ